MRRIPTILIALLGLVCAVIRSAAETYPSRPITMIVPFAAGAPVDLVGPPIAERMRVITRATGHPRKRQRRSRQHCVLPARPARRLTATPSASATSARTCSTAPSTTLSIDVLKDFEPVALLASNPQLILSRNSLPASDLKGLIAWLKANPGNATAGTGGTGGVSHIAGVFFEKETGSHFEFVPYRGTNLAQQDLIGGQIDVLFDQAVSALANVRTGKIRAYAVTARTRLPSATSIPTVDEAGMPGFYMSVWNALWVPKNTPKEIVVRLNAAVVKSLPILRSANVWRSSDSKSRLATSRRRRHCASSMRRKSTNGGRSSERRTSRLNRSCLNVLISGSGTEPT